MLRGDRHQLLAVQNTRAQPGDEHHCGHPGGEQGDAHHGEDREGVFPRCTLGEAHGQEAGGGDQRAGEHGKGRGGIGEGRSLVFLPALLHFHHHHFHGDDGVIHQQPQGDDQRAQGDALQVYARRLHREEGDRQHDGNGNRHHQASAQPQEEETHRQDDGDRLQQALHEFVDVAPHHFRLIRHLGEFQAHGQGGGQARGRGPDLLSQCHDVAATDHRHRQAHGYVPVPVEVRLRRIGVATPHLRNISQTE